MNTSAAADALDQGDTDRARIRVRTGRLVLCIAREPSWLADGPKVLSNLWLSLSHRVATTVCGEGRHLDGCSPSTVRTTPPQ
jgi:hypothetical protein